MKLSVKAIRVNAKKTQKETAKYLKISLTAYCRKENGHSPFWAHEIAGLSVFFGVKIDVFYASLCHIRTQVAGGIDG